MGLLRRLAPALAIALSLAGCVDASNVDADSDVAISGTLGHADGSPAPGVPIRLYREADVGEAFVAFASAGLTCLADERKLAICSHGDDAESDGEGAFRYALKGRDTHGFLGNAATLELTAALDRAERELAGPAVTVRFQVQTRALVFPLRFWAPDVRATSDGRLVRVDWPLVGQQAVPPQVDVSRLTYQLAFERSGGDPVWGVAAVQGSTVFDRRVLEDADGSFAVAVQGRAIRVPDSLGREIDLVLRSARVPFRSDAGPPSSRGAACSVAGADGKPVQQTPCQLTDGVFGTRFSPPTCPPNGPCTAATSATMATIDLGAVRDASFIVIRGCVSRCTVESSEPGSPYRVVGVTQSDAGDVAMSNPGGRARYVRISSDALTDLREVSVWGEATNAAAPPRSIVAKIDGLLPPAAQPDRALPIAVATGFAAVAAIGLAAAAAHRARRASQPLDAATAG